MLQPRLTPELVMDYLGNLWTVQELARMFRVTPMTIHLWRQNRGLPVIMIPGEHRPAIRFDPDAVMDWAEANEVRIRLQPIAA